jgi:uncharacterized membrane protein YkvA (DUF1232 family)
MDLPKLPLIAVAVTILVWLLCVLALILVGRRGDAVALARFIPDCLVLVKRLLSDERVSRWRKLVLVPLIGYLAMPIDLVPDFVPVAGQLDDAIVIGFALRVVLRGGDRALLREHWPGPIESRGVVERFAFGRP